MEKFYMEKEKNAEKINENASEHDLLHSYIEKILTGEHDYLDDEIPANYDAIFENGKEPYFINIWNRKKGSGLGYIVFHHFLMLVGANNIFCSTNFTEDGLKLFEKAKKDGLIQQVSEKSGPANISRWKIIGDSKVNLEKIRDSLEK